MPESPPNRWQAQRGLANTLRVLTLVGPIAVSIGFVWLATQYIHIGGDSLPILVGWWLALSVVSTAILFALDRLARRLLPLAALFQLSLVFPDEAPSRFRTAISSLTAKDLERELEAARDNSGTPAEAAERLLRFVALLTAHDRRTRGHSERVRAYSQMIGVELGLSQHDIDRLNWAALVHDVGKLAVSRETLNKDGKPTDDEWVELRAHAAEGARMIEPLRDWLGEWADAVGEHHEHWDGKGYPKQIEGEDISLGGRIVAVADVFDVITSPRSYKPGGTVEEARQELTDCAGTQFDPRIVRAFLNVSLGRLRVATGPLAWIANIPLIGQASLSSAIGTSAGSLAIASTAFVGVLGGGALAQEPAAPTQEIAVVASPSATVEPTPRPAPSGSATIEPVDEPADEPGTAPSPAEQEPAAPAEPATAPSSPTNPAPSTPVNPPVPQTPSAPISTDAPDVSDAIDEDTSATITLDLPNAEQVTSLSVVREPDVGTLAIPSADTLTYEPPADYNGLVTSDYEACWSGGICDRGRVSVSVAPVNDAPVAVPDDVGAGSDPRLLDVLENDIDVDGDEISLETTASSLAIVRQPIGGVSLVGGKIRYEPPPAFSGEDTFEYRITDGNGGSDTGSVKVMVTPDNVPPVAGNDVVSLSEGGVASFSVLSNDSDADGSDLTLAGYDDSGIRSGTLVHDGGGDFTYTAASDFVGTESFAYKVVDSRGGGDGAVVDITVTGVNDAPRFTPGANVTIAEDAGAQSFPGWASAISPGPADEAGQTVSFVVSNDNPALFASPPAVTSDGTLFFTPAANANGLAAITVQPVDDGGTLNGGADTGLAGAAVISVTAVNDPPRFSKGADISLLEDAGAQSVVGWATGINAGPPNEIGQAVSFTVSNDNPALFSAAPALASNGTLSFTPQANASGTATVTIRATDNGGVANGGVDTSSPRTATITISPVNDAPEGTIGPDLNILEDAGAQSLNGWMTGVSPGPGEAAQSISFTVSNDNAGLFSSAPAIASDGTLSFTTAPNANGRAVITVTPRDDGGTANGGTDVGAVQAATILVDPVNDAPSVTAGADVTVLSSDGPQSLAGWATGISPGPTDESAQTVSLSVTTDNPDIFSVAPAVAGDGTLTFTPDPAKDGVAIITVVPSDDGGTANGGVDTGPGQTATITINPPSSSPNFYLQASGSSPDEWSISRSKSTNTDADLDTDGDGNPGLTILQSSGTDTETDGAVFQDWVYRPTRPLSIDGAVTASLWLSGSGISSPLNPRIWLYIYECDAGGTNCVVFEQINSRLLLWSDNQGWGYYWRYVGWETRTILPGKELRVKLLTSDASIRVATSQGRASRIRLQLG